MNYKTPALVLLGLLLAAVSLSVLGLAADNISYYEKNSGDALDIHYIRWNSTAEAQYSYWLKMNYAPSRYSLGKEYAELITGLFCALIGAGIAVGAWVFRTQKAAQSGSSLKTRFAGFLPVALILASVSFFLSLAVTAWVWQDGMAWPISFIRSLPLPPKVSDPSASSPVSYQSPFDYTPEVWNCLLAPYVVSASQSNRMETLCSEAKVARIMLLPTLIISAVLVVGLGWAWRQSSQATSTEVEMNNVKDVDEVSVESKDEGKKEDYN